MIYDFLFSRQFLQEPGKKPVPIIKIVLKIQSSVTNIQTFLNTIQKFVFKNYKLGFSNIHKKYEDNYIKNAIEIIIMTTLQPIYVALLKDKFRRDHAVLVI